MYIAISNSIGSSSRVNAGGGGGGFPNTYSLAFDGVDDFIGLGSSTGLNFSGDFTLSAWVKTDSIGNKQYIVDTSGTISFGSGYSFSIKTDGKIRFWSFIAQNTAVDSITALSAGTWYHITCIHTSTQNKIYINGVLDVTLNWTTGHSQSNTTNLRIGGSSVLNGYFDGNIDEVAFWNSDQSANIDSIYSATGAVDLTSLNPTAWYRNGDNGSYKSPQWLIPNNSNKDKVSNYSLQFDGVDDEILTSSNFVATGEFTISLWMKPTIFNSNQNILGFGTSGSNFINPSSATNIRVRTSSTLLNFPETGGNNLVLNAWNHILIYRDSSNNIGVFVNGATFGATSNDTGSLSLSTIGRGATKRFAGNLDEIAFWNTNKSSDISSIYSGGTPSDLSSLSPVAYYKMGEEATFVYNVNPEGTWTIPDQAGSSDGTSNNTFLDTGRVGDAPNSTSNAVSFNMLETDRKEDTPPTP